MKKLIWTLAVLLAVTGCGQQGVVNNNMTTSSNHTTPTTPKQTGFDYEKLLGFQPLLPAKVPSGYILKNIQTEIDTLGKEGNVYSFSAFYQNGDSYFGVWEGKATGHTTVPMPNSPQKVTINGISGVSYAQDGYNLQFTRGGIIYRVEGQTLSDEQIVMTIASFLTVPAQKKPDKIIRRSFTK